MPPMAIVHSVRNMACRVTGSAMHSRVVTGLENGMKPVGSQIVAGDRSDLAHDISKGLAWMTSGLVRVAA